MEHAIIITALIIMSVVAMFSLLKSAATIAYHLLPVIGAIVFFLLLSNWLQDDAKSITLSNIESLYKHGNSADKGVYEQYIESQDMYENEYIERIRDEDINQLFKELEEYEGTNEPTK